MAVREFEANYDLGIVFDEGPEVNDEVFWLRPLLLSRRGLGLSCVFVVKGLEGVAMDGWAAPAACGGHHDVAEWLCRSPLQEMELR